MNNEMEIFRAYVLKRLEEDKVFGYNDFPIEQSESLKFLSAQFKTPINKEPKQWVTEYDGYEKERVLKTSLTPETFITERAENIKNITKNASNWLQKNILMFEACTRYLYTPTLASREKIISDLEHASDMFTQREDILLHKTLYKQIQKLSGADEKEQQAQRRQESKSLKRMHFYELIRQIHDPKNKNQKIELYTQLYRLVPYRNEDDVRGFIEGHNYKITPRLKAHLTAELRHDILEKLYKAYLAKGLPEAKALLQDIADYNKSYKHWDKRLLGPNGAFEAGGLYGPDSPFAKQPNIKQKNAPLKDTRKTGKDLLYELNHPDKKQTFTQLKIFSDKDFDY